MRFAKGHGTGNDFVLLPDAEGTLDLQPALVAAVCDRRRGIGADGVLRVVPTRWVPEAASMAGQAAWFMDYRNADGSVAEMCGNGIRVFVRYLVDEGLLSLPAGATTRIATRAGVLAVRSDAPSEPDRRDELTVALGRAGVLGYGELIEVRAGELAWPAVGVSLPNPHAVAFVEDVLLAGDLREAPVVTPHRVYPDGVNVEFVEQVGERVIRMRVHERGVGETRSCGTGAGAAAVATMDRDAAAAGTPYDVHVPGGRLTVVRREDAVVELTGPAVIVARGVLSPGWPR